MSQRINQTVPSESQRCVGLHVQQIVQLTRAHSRLAAQGTGNKVKNLSRMLLPFITSCIVLVPRLSAVPQELACTRNCYFGVLTLCVDLPGRFFTTLTP
ncbi:hypothetical protein NGUA34_01786 [Salmonella enterica]|nr:hypothetical protein NGUA34_01786 [Salmonella enterica]